MKKLLLTLLILVATFAPSFAKEVTFTPSEFGIANASAIGTQTKENAQIVFGTGVLYYTSGASARVYANNEVTFKALNGAILEKIVFTYSQNSFTTKTFTSSVPGTFSNGTWTAPANEEITSFTIKNGDAQVRLSKIVVTYSEPVREATKIDITPEPVDGKVEIEKGQAITFTADAGTQLSVNGEMVANPYTINPTEEGELTAYAVFEGDVLENVSATVAWTFKAAAPVGDFVFSPEAEEVVKGTEITFTAPNAVESSYAYRFDEGEWVAGNAFTVTEDCIVEVKAANVDGVEATDARLYTILPAPEVGAFVFSIDDESGEVSVLAGTEITFTAPNAVEGTYAYSINDGEWVAGNTFTVTEECMVEVKAANADGKEKSDIRIYTIREAEIYTRVTSMAQIKEGVKYVMIAKQNETTNFYGMKPFTSNSYAEAASVTVDGDNYVFNESDGLQVFTLEKLDTGWGVNLGEKYLTASGSGTPGFGSSTSAGTMTIEINDKFGAVVKSGDYPILYNNTTSPTRFKFYSSGSMSTKNYGTGVLYGLLGDAPLEATVIVTTPVADAEGNINLWAGETVTVEADYGDYILVNEEKVANPYTFAPEAGEYTVYALNANDEKGISTTFNVNVKENVLYGKVTGMSGITAEGKYVLVSEKFNSVASECLNGDRITSSDVTINNFSYVQREDALVFSFEEAEGGYYLVLENGLYLAAATDRPSFVEKSGASVFTVSFKDGNVVIASGGRTLMRNSTATNNIIRFYTSGSPLALYAATEAVAAPEKLYCHGVFTYGHWTLHNPIEFQKDGDVFFFEPVMLGELDGEAHFFFSDSKTEAPAEETIATLAATTVDWASLTDNSTIYAPAEGNTTVAAGTTMPVAVHAAGTFGNTQPHSFVAPANQPMIMTVDFSTGVPALSLAESTQTGVAGIGTDDSNAPVEFYNLQGIRVENPAAGLYIRRQGNSTAKVYVK